MADATEVNWDDQHPFGPGSHCPLDDVAEMPSGYPIKGNLANGNRRTFHRSDSREYAATRAEVWFDSPTMADAAGFELSPSHPEGSSNEPFEPGGDEHPCTGQEVEANRLAAAGIAIIPPIGPGERGERVGAAELAEEVEPGQLAADPDRHPYGVGSHAPLADVAEMPRFYPVKGRVDSNGGRWYHRPDSSEYRSIEAAAWFDSPSAAEATGFELAATHPSAASSDDFEPGGSDHGWTLAEVRSARTNALIGAGGLAMVAAQRSAAPDLDAEADGETTAQESAPQSDSGGAAAAATAGTDVGGGDDPADDLDAGGIGADDVDGAEDDSSGLELGLAAAGGAAAAAAGVAAITGDGDGEGEGEPGLPDLEDAATDVSHSRIIEETSEFASGGDVSPDATAAVPAGGELGAGGLTGDDDDRAGETVQVSGAPPARATTTGELSPAVVNRSRRAGNDRADFGRLLWLGLGAIALLGLLALVLGQCGGGDDSVIGGGSDGTEIDGEGADSDGADSGDSDAGNAAAADDGSATPGGADSDGADSSGAASDAAGDGRANDEDADGAAGDSAWTGQADDSDDGSANDGSANEGSDDGGVGAAGDAGSADAADTAGVELQALALATLDDAGLGNLDVEVDGDVLRLVGDVGSQADADAAMAVIKTMPGMASEMTVESALVVEAGAADDDSGPDPVEDQPSYTG